MTERKYNTLAEEMEATDDIQIDSTVVEQENHEKPVVERSGVENNSTTVELKPGMKAQELIGARKYRKAEQSYHNLMDTLILREIQQKFDEGDPAMLDWGDNFQMYCQAYEDESYKTIMQRINHLNVLGEDFMSKAEYFKIPVRDLRRIKRLPDGKRREVIGLVMSGHSEDEEVKDLVKDLLSELEVKNEALDQAHSELQEARTSEKVNLIEQRYTLESEKQDLQEELERSERAIQDKDEQLQKYYALETANGKLQLAEDIQRRINTLTRDVQALDYNREDATETLENMMEQIAAGINNLAEIINVHFLGE